MRRVNSSGRVNASVSLNRPVYDYFSIIIIIILERDGGIFDDVTPHLDVSNFRGQFFEMDLGIVCIVGSIGIQLAVDGRAG